MSRWRLFDLPKGFASLEASKFLALEERVGPTGRKESGNDQVRSTPLS